MVRIHVGQLSFPMSKSIQKAGTKDDEVIDVEVVALEPGRIEPLHLKEAFVVAIVVDFLQLPINVAFLAAFASVIGIEMDIPLEMIDLGLDVVAAVWLTSLLGFQTVFLPAFLIEAVPLADAVPTWTASVAFVAWKQRKTRR